MGKLFQITFLAWDKLFLSVCVCVRLWYELSCPQFTTPWPAVIQGEQIDAGLSGRDIMKHLLVCVFVQVSKCLCVQMVEGGECAGTWDLLMLMVSLFGC